MATITPTLSWIPGRARGAGDLALYTWTPVTESDTCSAVSLPEYNDKTIQITGTIGTAHVAVNGSLDGVTYAALRDASSTTIDLTALGVKTILENTVWVQPAITSGSGASLTIMILFHMNNPLRT